MENKLLGLRQAAVPKPPSALDKLKAWVSPKSTAGALSGRKKKLDEQIKEAGG